MAINNEYQQRMRNEQLVRDAEATQVEEKMSQYQHEVEIFEYIKAINPLPNDWILDAGGGTGRVARSLSSTCKKVIIADLSLNSLSVAKERSAHLEGAVLCVQCDLANLPFKSGTFNKVIVAGVLEHVPESNIRVAIIGSLARIAVPGGKLVLSIYNWHLKRRLIGKKDVPHELNFDHYFTLNDARKELLEVCSRCQINFDAVRIYPILNLLHMKIGEKLGPVGQKIDHWLGNFPWLSYIVGTFLLCDLKVDYPEENAIIK